MPEIVLKIRTVGPNPKYQDGDIVAAFNQRRIRCVHAEHLCHLGLFGFNGDGLRPNSLAQFLRETTHQYRFDVVSPTEVRRTNLITLDEETIGPTPNVNGEHIRLAEYLGHALRHPKHIIFGTKGNEHWYGGRIDVSNAKLDTVWTKIEAETPERESSAIYQKWPLSGLERARFLTLTVDDFTDTKSSDLTAGEYTKDDPPVLLKKRQNRVDWKSLSLGKSPADILDESKQIDTRESKSFLVANIVSKK